MGLKPRKRRVRLGPIEKTETAEELARRMAASLCEDRVLTTRFSANPHIQGYRAATAYWLRGLRGVLGDHALLPGAYWSHILDRYVQPGDDEWDCVAAKSRGSKG